MAKTVKPDSSILCFHFLFISALLIYFFLSENLVFSFMFLLLSGILDSLLYSSNSGQHVLWWASYTSAATDYSNFKHCPTCMIKGLKKNTLEARQPVMDRTNLPSHTSVRYSDYCGKCKRCYDLYIVHKLLWQVPNADLCK